MDGEYFGLFEDEATQNDSTIFQNLYLDFINEFNNSTIIPRKRMFKILLIGFSAVGWLGNVLICYVIVRNKSMRTTINYYLISIAVSDSLILLAFSLGAMYTLRYSRISDIYPKFSISRFLTCTSALASVFATLAITVDRYIAVCRPFTGRKLFNKRRTAKIILVLWIVSILYSLGLNLCADKLVSICDSIMFVFESHSLITFFLPLMIILVLYTLIGLNIWRTLISSKMYDNQRGSFKRKRLLTKGLNLTVAVVIEFIACWMPLHIVLMCYNYVGVDFRATFLLSGIGINLLFTIINPMIYSIMSNEFRKAFKDVLCPSCKPRRSRLVSENNVEMMELKVFRRTI